MNRRLAYVAVALLLPQAALGAIHVPVEVKQSVVFLYGEEDDRTFGAGTGFLVGIPHVKTPDRIFVYLVTAKHCLQKRKEGSFYPRVHVRINLRTGDSEVVHIPLGLEGPEKNVYTHTDSSVDLAVIPVVLEPTRHDVRVLGASFFTGEDVFEKLGLGDGTDVFFTGLFTPYQGARRNYPIVRFGRVALVTPEPIEWRKGVKSRLYLMETSAFGGNSGSPVFFYPGSDRTPGDLTVARPKLFLAGVMTLAFEEKRSLEVSTAPRPEPRSVGNLGVAGVTPCFLLQDILYGDELKRLRDK